ncbi:Uncharacterized protein CTYZ_00003937 [Cryptosporidium tyzzeri]|nr:Uncharacterized protein CTYZ_00003937 [Cryptosporidium tyzzeri]
MKINLDKKHFALLIFIIIKLQIYISNLEMIHLMEKKVK